MVSPKRWYYVVQFECGCRHQKPRPRSEILGLERCPVHNKPTKYVWGGELRDGELKRARLLKREQWRPRRVPIWIAPLAAARLLELAEKLNRSRPSIVEELIDRAHRAAFTAEDEAVNEEENR